MRCCPFGKCLIGSRGKILDSLAQSTHLGGVLRAQVSGSIWAQGLAGLSTCSHVKYTGCGSQQSFPEPKHWPTCKLLTSPHHHPWREAVKCFQTFQYYNVSGLELINTTTLWWSVQKKILEQLCYYRVEGIKKGWPSHPRPSHVDSQEQGWDYYFCKAYFLQFKKLWLNQMQKDTYCMIPLIGSTQSTHIHRDRKKGGYQGLGKGSGNCLMS